MPSQRAGGAGHFFSESGRAQWRHWKLAFARRFEDVAALVDFSIDIAGLAGDSDGVLDLVVKRLEFVVAERPVLNRRAFGNTRCAIASDRFTPDFEVPWAKPPALSPIMDRGSTHGIHHGVSSLN